ncbi:GNAT family N-acetyltransferase [Aquabacterium humicola]|uniref:GNAT family N-acetyltransferase n=1 Tax=Aquabacterium humicola TaxID=3237377 RepID=UPI002543CCEB|nr:GNAT family N-acetyltransferase [Rubrivivax pictus]
MTILTTARLRLEPFADAHLDGLQRMNSDPEVMRYLGGRAETREETRAAIDRVKARWAEWGYSWWSFFEHDGGELVGAGCIQHLGRERSNPLEIGWRLRQDRWGRGLASEAAERMAAFAFDDLAAPLLVATCHVDNAASARVMQRLGMVWRGVEQWYGEDAAVYQIDRAAWLRRATMRR